MKKQNRNLKQLTLNKNVVSQLGSHQIQGGDPASMIDFCPIDSQGDYCPIDTIACNTALDCPAETQDYWQCGSQGTVCMSYDCTQYSTFCPTIICTDL